MITFQPGAEGGRDAALYRHRVADQTLLAPALPPLAPFRHPDEAVAGAEPPAFPGPAMDFRADAADEAGVYAGEGWVGGKLRRVESWKSSLGYRIEVEGAGRFLISSDGAFIRGFPRPASSTGSPLPDPFVQAFLGPALLVALALHGRFALHASGVVAPAGAVLLLGPSGAGKSTLAAGLATAAPDHFRLLADDVLPVAPPRTEARNEAAEKRDAPPEASEPAWAMGRFPQLKLAAQPSLAVPEKVPLAACCVLAGPPPEGQRRGVEQQPLSPLEAVFALVRHTVASRLFAAELMEHHLTAAAALAGACPVLRLAVPWSARPAEDGHRRVAESLLEKVLLDLTC